jgi:predicted ATPase/DNA-binding XRE family transcriptional regulator
MTTVSSTSSTFATLLRRHRLASGLTQEALAERAGLSTRGVQDLERGVRVAPRAETVRLLADALGLSAETRAGLIAAAHPELAAPGASLATPLHLPALPIPLTGLIGREREVAAACALLRRAEDGAGTRLLTLTGPGGVGKTRLALAIATEVGADFADGVAWVDLAPLRDPTAVTPVVARALAVRDGGDRPLGETLAAALTERRLLLVLDNCEHLLAAMSVVGALLASCPGLAVLTTSRTRLRLRGEREQPVEPLPVPQASEAGLTPLATLARVAAVQLFVERARATAPAFTITDENAAAVVGICRRLEGLPLALELAAARAKVLAPATLLTRLEQRLPLLSGGPRDAPDRQQTMRNAIAWSHDLLTPDMQALFRRLAVFAGGFTLEAAAAVAAGRADTTTAEEEVLEGLAILLDHSLLRLMEPPQRGATTEARFAMLETVREFAMERLAASDEEETIRRVHAAYHLALAELAQDRIHGPDGPATLDRLETEHDNLRAALAWAADRGETETALRLVNACWRFWWMHSHLDQGRLWLDRALTLSVEAAGSVLRPLTLVAASYFARIQGDFARAIATGEEALAAAGVVGDPHAEAAASYALGLVALDRGDLEVARGYQQAALTIEREIGNRHGVAMQLSCLGDVAAARGDLAEARSHGEEALAIWRDRGDAWGVSWGLIQLGTVARAEGDEVRAIALYRQSLVSNAQLGDKDIIARAASRLADIACHRGQFVLAARLYGVVTALREAIGAPLAPAERARYQQAVAAARAGLDEAAFSHAWEAGRAMATEHAFAAALAAVDELT